MACPTHRGVELTGDGTAELKRFYVDPLHRRTGAASAIITALLSYAATAGARVIRLETGIEQHAAIRFYARHGFEHIEPFGPYLTKRLVSLRGPPAARLTICYRRKPLRRPAAPARLIELSMNGNDDDTLDAQWAMP